jgi:hypothetical protein
MILGRGIVGVADKGIVFVEKPVNVKKVMKVALKAVGHFVDVVPVGRIRALFVDDPVYPLGCSPNYGLNSRYETARHCVMARDICRVRDAVNMSDGSRTSVTNVFRYNACERWICWVFAKIINRFGWVYDQCIEEFDNAVLNRGNEGKSPDLILFAGSEDGRLALFVRSIDSVVRGRKLPPAPFRVRMQSVDYWIGDKPKIVNWEAVVNGTGLFLVWFGNYVLPYRAYFSYPTAVQVKPGFSGSNAYIVG